LSFPSSWYPFSFYNKAAFMRHVLPLSQIAFPYKRMLLRNGLQLLVLMNVS
jgi:hypothetical protein